MHPPQSLRGGGGPASAWRILRARCHTRIEEGRRKDAVEPKRRIGVIEIYIKLINNQEAKTKLVKARASLTTRENASYLDKL